MDQQVKALMILLQCTEQQLFGERLEGRDVEGDESTSEGDYSIEDAASIIRSSVDSLMGLLPSMERILVSLESPVLDRT